MELRARGTGLYFDIRCAARNVAQGYTGLAKKLLHQYIPVRDRPSRTSVKRRGFAKRGRLRTEGGGFGELIRPHFFDKFCKLKSNTKYEFQQ